MNKFTRRGALVGLAAASIVVPGVVVPPSGPPAKPKPTITLSSTKPFAFDAKKITRVLRRYVDDYLSPVWGCEATLTWADKPNSSTWNMIFAAGLDEPAIAYHDFNPKKSALPFAVVDVGAAMNHSGNVTQAASHELGEMLVNPGTNYWAGIDAIDTDASTRLLAMEIADPVQEASFTIEDTQVSDFVYPAFFEPWRDGALDACGVLPKRALSAGGYQIVWDVSGPLQIHDVFGAKAPTTRCARHTQIMRRAAQNKN